MKKKLIKSENENTENNQNNDNASDKTVNPEVKNEDINPFEE